MTTRHVFTYGSLMFERVWRALVSGRYHSMPATLRGYRRQRVRGQDYPSLQRLPDSHADGSVDGLLYLNVESSDLAALDAFEGADYRRIEVPIVLAAPQDAARATVLAATYLFIADDKVEPGPWSPDLFEREAMERFLRDYPPPRPAVGTADEAHKGDERGQPAGCKPLR
jgi:gamma-glutamylcyclotransferase (GGCT)/AIG2-like uncharacterized protein YtfP